MIVIMSLAVYAYSALCFQRIARGLAVKHTWFAWIPVLNVYLVCRIAGKRYLWTVLCFIPVVNVIMYILICFKLSRACGKGRVMGLLLLVPVVNLIVLWVLVVRAEGIGAAPETGGESGNDPGGDLVGAGPGGTAGGPTGVAGTA